MKECQILKKEIAFDTIKKLDETKYSPDIIIVSETKEYKNELYQFFDGNNQLLERLEKLDKKKTEIKEIRKYSGNLEEPIVVTLSGTPRAGKTTCIDNLVEFFRKGDIRTACLEEPAGIIYHTLKSKEEKKQLLSDRVGFVEQQYAIGLEYIKNNLEGNDIILCDRGIIDTFIWYDMYYKLGMIPEKRYLEYLKRLETSNKYKNLFYALFTDGDVSMKRDYQSSLSIEPRTTMNIGNIQKYNDSMVEMLPIFEQHLDYVKMIDTTKYDRIDSSIEVADEVLDVLKKAYSKQHYNL